MSQLKRYSTCIANFNHGLRPKLTICNKITRAAIFAFVVTLVFGEAMANEELINKCNSCHGNQGNSLSSFAPSIAGMQKYYMKWVVDAYINNNRPPGLMKDLVANLTPAEISVLADYYARQKFIPVVQDYKKDLAQKGQKLHYQYCEKCHENGGAVSNSLPGLIAGQWMGYNRTVLGEYILGKRKGNSMMKIKLDKMIKIEGLESIENLVHFYASAK